jgi:D-3-phosphoglycerate dehydrogenase
MYRTRVRTVIPDDFPPVYAGRPDLVERLRSLGEVEVFSTRPDSETDLVERLSGANAVVNVRAYCAFPASVIAACPHLRLISIVGTGTDHIDLRACTEAGVVVVNTPGASTASVAELTVALILAAARRIPETDRRVRSGEWYHHEGVEMAGKTLGLVGLGLIGQAVARVGTALGMRVLAWSFRADHDRAAAAGVAMVSLERLLAESDVVSIHLRNSAESKGLIGATELARMKPGAILVNTARAAIVDEPALIEALRTGGIAAAGIDVLAQEPLPPDSPWLTLENVVLTPHVGWVTREASERLAALPVENVERFFAGDAANVVNPAALAHPKQECRPS